MEFNARIDGGSGGEKAFIADSLAEAMVAAEAWARDGDWDASEGTIWIDLSVSREDEDGDIIEEQNETIAIDPEEPDCEDGEGHDWQSPIEIVGGIKENPGCWGHGGGVIIEEVCVHCGCRRRTDTWAQRQDTGEQGLQSIKYDPGHYRVDAMEE